MKVPSFFKRKYRGLHVFMYSPGKRMGKGRDHQKTPQNTDSPIYVFLILKLTPDIAAALRTFRYKQWKNTGTESDIVSDANRKNGTS